MRISILAVVFILFVGSYSQNSTSSMKVQLPPFSHGGIMSLWYDDHKFLMKEYGEFDLLNYKNTDFALSRDSISAYNWKLFVMGNYINKDLSYATLARVKNLTDGLLLVMFQWHEPTDTTKKHGVFFQTFIGKKKLLLRTKQSLSGGVDTLELSCGDLKKRCGVCYYDDKQKKMVIKMTGKK